LEAPAASARELLPPVCELLPERSLLQPLALPGREVRVLDRQIGKGRLAGNVGRVQASARAPALHRPAVADGVVHCESHRMFAAASAGAPSAKVAQSEIERRAARMAAGARLRLRRSVTRPVRSTPPSAPLRRSHDCTGCSSRSRWRFATSRAGPTPLPELSSATRSPGRPGDGCP